jgi:hypothetical protein
MARTKRRVTEYEEDDKQPEYVARLDPDEETYTAFMAKWGREGAKVRVYRVTPQGKQYCFLAAPDEVDPEAIRLFHAKQSYAHETGQYLIEVEVNGEVRPPFPILIAPQVGAPGAPEASAGGMSGPMGEMFRMLQAQNERLMALHTQQQTAAAREPIGDLADALVKLDQLRGGGSKELPMDTIMKAIQIGKELGPGSGDSWIALIRESLPALAPAIQSIAGSLAGRAAQTPPQNGGETVTTEEAMMKAGIGYLKKKALAGSDAGLYVDMVVDNRTDAPYDQLIRRILESDFSAFAAIDPEISRPEYEPFFRAIYDGIRSVFIEQNTVVINPAGQDGDAGNASGNEAPRKPRQPKS